MKTSVLKISEDRSVEISWGAIVFLLGLVFGFAAWMTSVELKAQDLTQKISVLESIDKRLYRIEILLESIKPKGK